MVVNYYNHQIAIEVHWNDIQIIGREKREGETISFNCADNDLQLHCQQLQITWNPLDIVCNGIACFLRWYLKQLQARHHRTAFSYVFSSFLLVVLTTIYMQKVIASIASAHYSRHHHITQTSLKSGARGRGANWIGKKLRRREFHTLIMPPINCKQVVRQSVSSPVCFPPPCSTLLHYTSLSNPPLVACRRHCFDTLFD